MKCKTCGKSFIPKHPSQKFCSHKGFGNCKDKYWNKHDPNKKCRITLWFVRSLGYPTIKDYEQNHGLDDYDGDDQGGGHGAAPRCEWCGLRTEYCDCYARIGF